MAKWVKIIEHQGHQILVHKDFSNQNRESPYEIKFVHYQNVHMVTTSLGFSSEGLRDTSFESQNDVVEFVAVFVKKLKKDKLLL
jgi:hypothetical protein